MKVKYDDLEKILLNQFGWKKELVTLGRTSNNGAQVSTTHILKHPTKKLYFKGGILGKAFRIWRGWQVDITHRYYEFSYAKEYEFDSNTGLLTLDDILCLNLK